MPARDLRGKLRPLLVVWAVLMTLLALTIGATFIKPLGAWRQPISLTIAATKAGLILWWFMEVRKEHGLTRLFIFGIGAFLTIMFTLFASDYLTRGWMET